jgi:hypothetical protein
VRGVWEREPDPRPRCSEVIGHLDAVSRLRMARSADPHDLVPTVRLAGSGRDAPLDSWAYADFDEARENPESAAWGYVDKTVYTCRKCHNRWTIAGEFRPFTEDQGAAVVSFENDDSGHRAWLHAWPIGFVLNCNRHPTSDYLILHRATCRFITELDPRMKTFTGEYIKVCSTDRRAVKQWARAKTGGRPSTAPTAYEMGISEWASAR